MKKATEQRRRVEWIQKAICFIDSGKRCQDFSHGDCACCLAKGPKGGGRQIRNKRWKNDSPNWCPKKVNE